MTRIMVVGMKKNIEAEDEQSNLRSNSYGRKRIDRPFRGCTGR